MRGNRPPGALKRTSCSPCPATTNTGQAFDNVADSNDAGSDFAWVHIYNESDAINPLDVEGTGEVDITGSDGQQDEVIQSSITTANQPIGKFERRQCFQRLPVLLQHDGSCVFDSSLIGRSPDPRRKPAISYVRDATSIARWIGYLLLLYCVQHVHWRQVV